MLKTTPAGEPLAVMTAGGTEVSVELDPSPQLMVTEPVPVVKSAMVASGLESVTVATSVPTNGIPSTGWIDAPCELSGASATVTVTPAAPVSVPPARLLHGERNRVRRGARGVFGVGVRPGHDERAVGELRDRAR